MKKVILVPVDGSKASMLALDEAIKLSQAYGDEVRLLNIQPSLKELGFATIQEGVAVVEKQSTPYSTKIRIGIPAIEIISEANDPEVRYVVMAIGKGKREDIGSVSRRVLELTRCPVVLVP